MRRTVILLILCAALATPMMATGDDQTMPLEARWTPTPPARSTLVAHQLASLLVDKGIDYPARVYPPDPATGVFAIPAQPRQGVDLG